MHGLHGIARADPSIFDVSASLEYHTNPNQTSIPTSIPSHPHFPQSNPPKIGTHACVYLQSLSMIDPFRPSDPIRQQVIVTRVQGGRGGLDADQGLEVREEVFGDAAGEFGD
jgi:hypothetical protein